MLQRKVIDLLINWKNDSQKKSLVVKGARQIGKTFSIEHFGKTYYKNYIYINFIESPSMKMAFDGDLSVDEILKQLSLRIPHVVFSPKNTLIFLDEIQACPQARTALKFFTIDGRFDVVASGSLLGLNNKEVVSFPVGYETQLEMHALDFEEYLWAVGVSPQAIEDIRRYYDSRSKVPDFTNDILLRHMREYMVIGGMPEVVSTFVVSKNFQEAFKIQRNIVSSYLDDIAKYASNLEKPKARNCFLSIPRQLAKENRKFQYSVVEKKSTARKYENSLEWLRDASLVNFCYNVSTPTIPLNAYIKEDQFKIYLNDVGLLTSMYDEGLKEAIVTNTLTGSAKGGIYENFIADILIKKGYHLYYYKTDRSSMEIEFLIVDHGQVLPLEVKASNNATPSLNEFLKKFGSRYGIKLITGNVGLVGNKVTYPLYMAMFL